GQFWDEGGMNRSMRKALRKKIQADPSLIERAKARAGGGPGLMQQVKSQAGGAKGMMTVLDRKGVLPDRGTLASRAFKNLKKSLGIRRKPKMGNASKLLRRAAMRRG
ncbi:MAG: hypothetical protein GWO24_26540, partial [Akkermansiaceae bacterium]|nr:hypothetical protein [Akkermansiaceae bacterium]